ncbi:MAG: hypothetical protein CVV55_06505, partial [Synergistetes bacterium HGW-Synergistetes-2]
ILPPIPTEFAGTEVASLIEGALFAPDIYKDLALADDLLNEVATAIYTDPEERPTPSDLIKRLQVSLNESSAAKNAVAKSFALTLTLKGKNPEELPQFLEKWGDAFIKRNSLLFVGRLAQSYDYINEAFTAVKKDLEKAEDSLLAYKKQHPASVLEIQLETMRKLHGEFLSQYTKDVRSLAPLEAKAKALREFLAAEPERVVMNKTVTNEALWNFLAQRFTRGELEHMQDLSLAEELFNTHHESLKAKLYDLDAEIVALKTSIADLGQHIAQTEKEYNQKNEQLLEIQKMTERLAREEKVLKESHDAMATKFQASRVAVAEAADPIRVIEDPVPPTTPVASKKALIVALSGVLGLFMGIFSALVVNMIQNRRAAVVQ